MTRGSTPAAALRDERAERLERRASRAVSSDATTSAAAPSLSADRVAGRDGAALAEAGFSAASFSSGRVRPRVLVARRRLAHRHELVARTRPASCAAAQRRCDSSANASCSSRETPYRSATFSAVSPIGSSGNSASSRGFGKRQPSVRVVDDDVAARAGRSAASSSRGARGSSTRRRRRRTRSASPAATARAGLDDGLEAGRAETVDRHAGHRLRAGPRAAPPSARRCGCPRPPGSRSRGRRRRSRRRVDARALDRGADGERGEVVGARGGESAAVAADRRPHRRDRITARLRPLLLVEHALRDREGAVRRRHAAVDGAMQQHLLQLVVGQAVAAAPRGRASPARARAPTRRAPSA